MRLLFVLVSAALLGIAAAPSAAQQAQPIELRGKAAFKHRHTKLQLPASLVGLPRTRALASEADHLDVAVEYAVPDQSEVLTIYLFRNVAADVPVWFDRAQWMIEHRNVYGKPSLRDRVHAFAPAGQSNASGLIAAYDLSGSDYRSTGVAMVPVGQWFLKVRASSRTIDAAGLDARIKAALASLSWPKHLPAAPAATPVKVCATGLALAGEAKEVQGDGASVLLNAILGMAVADGKATQAAPAPPVVWCRDAQEVKLGGVYRANEQRDGYLVAFADSGRAAIVGPNAGAHVLAQIDPAKKEAASWTVSLVLMQRTLTSGGFDRLPAPAQVQQVVEAGRFASSQPTWGDGKRAINVSSDAMK